MEKSSRLIVFSGEEFPYWKDWTKVYLWSQGHFIWGIMEEDYQLLAALQGISANNLIKFENNSKPRNILIFAPGRKEYARISHLETAHTIWKKLCDYNEGINEIKSMRLDTYTCEYQIFIQHPDKPLNIVTARFDNIILDLRSCGALTFTKN